jgi:transcriptional regulator with XRE-family HTH domain
MGIGTLDERLGGQIRALRAARELTQNQLAEEAGLSVDAIRRIERGAFSPSLETLRRLSHGLRVSLKTLFTRLEKNRRTDVAELCDYLSHQPRPRVRLIWRLVRALCDSK